MNYIDKKIQNLIKKKDWTILVFILPRMTLLRKHHYSQDGMTYHFYHTYLFMRETKFYLKPQ